MRKRQGTNPNDPDSVDKAPPLTPDGISFAGQTVSKFWLSWTPNVDPDLAGYRVYLYDPNRNDTYDA